MKTSSPNIMSDAPPFVAEAVARLLRPPPVRQYDLLTPEDTVAEILFGTKLTRHGHAPTPEERTFVAGQVRRYMDLGAPIDVMVKWGPTKNYGVNPEYDLPDVAELLGLRRFYMLHQQVARYHEPGLRVRLIFEDLTGTLLTKVDDASTRMRRYMAGLRALIESTDCWGVMVAETEWDGMAAAAPGADLPQLARAYGELMEAYWRDSEHVPVPARTALASFKPLAALGWRGPLEDSERDMYLKRAAHRYPVTYTRDDLIGTVALYLGVAVLRARYSYPRPVYFDRTGPVPTLKASFVPFPTASAAPRLGRIEYKLKDTAGKGGAPPWAAVGIIDSRGEPHIYPHTAPPADGTCHRHSVSLWLPTAGGTRTATIRADVLDLRAERVYEAAGAVGGPGLMLAA